MIRGNAKYRRQLGVKARNNPAKYLPVIVGSHGAYLPAVKVGNVVKTLQARPFKLKGQAIARAFALTGQNANTKTIVAKFAA